MIDELGVTALRPRYSKVIESDSGATSWFMIICDEGWRQSIVAEHMYEWVADWLIDILGRRAFAPDHH